VIEQRERTAAKPSISRREVFTNGVADGAELRAGFAHRFRARVDSLLVSRGEREEAEVEHLIRSQPGVTRPNIIAMVSPKGGVGKTTSTFLTGNLLATHSKLRVIAVDANPDFGTLAALAPDRAHTERSLADLAAEMESIATAAELSRYVSRLPSGLHLLGAPTDAATMAQFGPGEYGRLLAFLSMFYEVVLLDMGTGITDPLAKFAIDRADQIVVVTTPEYVTSQQVLGALGHLAHERATLVLNQARANDAADSRAIEGHFRQQRLHRSVRIPYDERLRTMLDSGTYTLEALSRGTRRPIKLLGLAVAEQLV
jgi:MinD-like ATPase involved in chromosome partitioning or flagellar assembly